MDKQELNLMSSTGQSPLFTTATITTLNNLDSEINQSCRELVHLCQVLGLYIVNGRFRGDSFSKIHILLLGLV